MVRLTQALRHRRLTMEESPGSGRHLERNLWRTPLKLPPLPIRLQETLDQLSPQELRDFRTILKNVDAEPRVKELRLELEGGNASGLAQLLAKYYDSEAARRVMVQVLQQLPRADLLPRWRSAAPAVVAAGQGELAGIPGAGAVERVLGDRGIRPHSPGILGLREGELERGERTGGGRVGCELQVRPWRPGERQGSGAGRLRAARDRVKARWEMGALGKRPGERWFPGTEYK